MRTPQRRARLGSGRSHRQRRPVVQYELKRIVKSMATIRNFASRLSGLFMMFSVDADCGITQGNSE
jgi:hypothetical protein